MTVALTKKRWGRRVLIGILVLILALVAALWLLMGSSISSLASLRRPDKDRAFFIMDYQADYALDKLMERGVSSDRELIDFLISNLLKGLPVSISLPEIGCTTFAAAKAQGGYLFGRNYDLDESPGLLVYTRPTSGYASMSMVSLNFLGFSPTRLPSNLFNSFQALAAPYAPLDGVNEKGLAVGVLMLQTEGTRQQRGNTPVTTTVAIRLMLDRAANVDEAVAILQRYDMNASGNSDYHFHLADAQGKSVVASYVDGELMVNPSRVATNFHLSPQALDPNGLGQDRFAWAQEALDTHQGVLTLQQAQELLETVQSLPAMWPDGETQTQWSAVYDLSTPGMTLAYGRDYSRWEHFSLGE